MRSSSGRKIFPVILAAVILVIAVISALLWLSPIGGKDAAENIQPANTISIPGYEMLSLKADCLEQDICLLNPDSNNCLFVISLRLADGSELWHSKETKPGQSTDNIILNKPLKAGTYPNSILKYECFRQDPAKTPLNGAETKLTLAVH